MSERQRTFQLKTNNLSDGVYDTLLKKAQSKNLGAYIQRLVEEDLQRDQHPSDPVIKDILHRLSSLEGKFNKGTIVKDHEDKSKNNDREIQEGELTKEITGKFNFDDLDEEENF